jgi:gamma-glutamylcysteine synthetase
VPSVRAARRLTSLANEFGSRFPERIDGPPTVGREAEFPIVDADGRPGDSTRLWPLLVERSRGDPHFDVDRDGRPLLAGVRTERWFCTAEVGLGTIEIGVGPRPSLLELERDLREALACVVAACAELGYRVLGYGIQPRTPPSSRLLTPKRRYLTLVDVIGAGWLRWTVTASDQLHVAMSRDRLVPAMNAVNAASGAIVALCANSSVYGGRAGAASGREALSARVTGEPFRNGAVRRAYADVEDYVRTCSRFRTLFLGDPKTGFVRYDEPFEELLDRMDLTFEDFLLHEHYLWPSARPRARLGTLEIRPACQQPNASFAAAALSLGLASAPDEVLELVGPSWPASLRYRADAVRRGMQADEPRPGFLADLVSAAKRGLGMRGLGEERHLVEIRDRLERRRGPADDAGAAFARAGAHALVAERALGEGTAPR